MEPLVVISNKPVGSAETVQVKPRFVLTQRKEGFNKHCRAEREKEEEGCSAASTATLWCLPHRKSKDGKQELCKMLKILEV